MNVEQTILACADRIKRSILKNFTYDDIENETGISVSTLKRITSGSREPKLSEIIRIAKAIGKNPIWLTFGQSTHRRTIDAVRSNEISNEIKENDVSTLDRLKLVLMVSIDALDNENDLQYLIKTVDLMALDKVINRFHESKIDSEIKKPE